MTATAAASLIPTIDNTKTIDQPTPLEESTQASASPLPPASTRVRVSMAIVHEIASLQQALNVAQLNLKLRITEIERDYGFRFGADTVLRPDGSVIRAIKGS